MELPLADNILNLRWCLSNVNSPSIPECYFIFFKTKIQIMNNELPLSKCAISFCGKNSDNWKLLAYALGATVTQSMTFYNSHLVMVDYERSKKKSVAKKYKIPVCGTSWLVECYTKCRVMPVSTSMYDKSAFQLNCLNGLKFNLNEGDSDLELLIVYCKGLLDSNCDFNISNDPSLSLYSPKWLKLCIIKNRIIELPGQECVMSDGEFEEIENREIKKEKPKKTDIVINDIVLEGRDIGDSIMSQSHSQLESHLSLNVSQDLSFCSPTPLSNSLMTPKDTGIFDGHAFVFCGLEQTTRRTYRSHILKNGGHCFSLPDVSNWTCTRDNQEGNIRTLLKYLKELKFTWILVWSSKLPFQLTSKKFLLKSSETNMAHVINETWLIDALSLNIIPALEAFEYKPFRFPLPLLEFEKEIICVTGYDVKYRTTIKNLIKILGATFMDAFTDKTTYLIAPKPFDPKNAKLLACSKFKIPIVTKEWLLQCVNTGKLVDMDLFVVQMPIISLPINTTSDAKPLTGIKVCLLSVEHKEMAVNLGCDLVNENEAQYIILEPNAQISNKLNHTTFVDPKWLLTCHKLQKRIPIDHFTWKKRKLVVEPVIPKKRVLKDTIPDVSYE